MNFQVNSFSRAPHPHLYDTVFTHTHLYEYSLFISTHNTLYMHICIFKKILSQKLQDESSSSDKTAKQAHEADAPHSKKLRAHTHSTAQTSSVGQTVRENIADKYPAEMLVLVHLSCDCKPWGGRKEKSECEFASLYLPSPGGVSL